MIGPRLPTKRGQSREIRSAEARSTHIVGDLTAHFDQPGRVAGQARLGHREHLLRLLRLRREPHRLGPRFPSCRFGRAAGLRNGLVISTGRKSSFSQTMMPDPTMVCHLSNIPLVSREGAGADSEIPFDDRRA